jgi:VanZ family protein
MTIYGLLAATAFYAFGSRLRRLYPRLIPLLVILICTLYGVSDEFHQSFVPNRSPDLFDVMADSTGAALVCIIFAVNASLQKKKSISCKEGSGGI